MLTVGSACARVASAGPASNSARSAQSNAVTVATANGVRRGFIAPTKYRNPVRRAPVRPGSPCAGRGDPPARTGRHTGGRTYFVHRDPLNRGVAVPITSSARNASRTSPISAARVHFYVLWGSTLRRTTGRPAARDDPAGGVFTPGLGFRA